MESQNREKSPSNASSRRSYASPFLAAHPSGLLSAVRYQRRPPRPRAPRTAVLTIVPWQAIVAAARAARLRAGHERSLALRTMSDGEASAGWEAWARPVIARCRLLRRAVPLLGATPLAPTAGGGGGACAELKAADTAAARMAEARRGHAEADAGPEIGEAAADRCTRPACFSAAAAAVGRVGAN